MCQACVRWCVEQCQACVPECQVCVRWCVEQCQACVPECQACVPECQACVPECQACVPECQVVSGGVLSSVRHVCLSVGHVSGTCQAYVV